MCHELTIAHINEAKQTLLEEKSHKETDHKTLIEQLLSSEMPESEKSTTRLTGEFISIISAGTFTTARTLVTAVYYIVADPQIEAKLREAFADPMAEYPGKTPRWFDLEKIPYLAACVKEGLR
jgi:cytochrome P450